MEQSLMTYSPQLRVFSEFCRIPQRILGVNASNGQRQRMDGMSYKELAGLRVLVDGVPLALWDQPEAGLVGRWVRHLHIGDEPLFMIRSRGAIAVHGRTHGVRSHTTRGACA